LKYSDRAVLPVAADVAVEAPSAAITAAAINFGRCLHRTPHFYSLSHLQVADVARAVEAMKEAREKHPLGAG
jgi:hypothetical protein